jgi:hypothetical protein
MSPRPTNTRRAPTSRLSDSDSRSNKNRRRTSRKHNARCAICGSGRNVEHHHIGGRKHLAWVSVPLCTDHHRQLHILLEQAGIDLRYTSDPVERMIRALGAISVLSCMIQNALQERYAASG